MPPISTTRSTSTTGTTTGLVAPKFGIRLLALLIDYGIILGWIAVLAGTSVAIASATGGFIDWLQFGTVGAQLLGFVLLVVPVGLYLFCCESSQRQATVGKRVLGLRVVLAASSERPSWVRVLARTVVKLLPWEVAHAAVWQIAALTAAGESSFPPELVAHLVVAYALPLTYLATVAFQKDRRGPHDLLAGTRVVRASQD